MTVLHLVSGQSPMFPPASRLRPESDGLVALGGDFRPETLVEAYSKGLFPWEGSQPIPWFSPDPRCVLFPTEFRSRRSLRKRERNSGWEVRVDTAFQAVMAACALVERPGQGGTWITPWMVESYGELYRRGVAHSVEVWEGEAMVGGLYGLSLGAAFFGESMFHVRPDASKVALGFLCRHVHERGFRFIDCQQDTPHLRSMGAVTVSRNEYMTRLSEALSVSDRWRKPV